MSVSHWTPYMSQIKIEICDRCHVTTNPLQVVISKMKDSVQFGTVAKLLETEWLKYDAFHLLRR